MSASPIAMLGYREVLAFWFGEDGGDAQAGARNSARWWQANAGFDAEVRARFAALREDAIAGEHDDWLHTPRGRLALIILIDQFSRNLFRNDARAFEHDALARHWCEEGLKITADDALHPIERVFFYLPLEHSESIADQDLAVTLFRLLRDSVPEPQREAFANYLRYSERHRGVIARFGRFPHRNVALGRESTAEELKFLEQPGSSF